MKPKYKVPTMAEIAKLKPNGYNVVSTFSGAGGSCLGYRMAGFKVLWANEFVPAAIETYKANHPDSILNTEDIRQVSPEDILSAIGLQKGDLDLFDGSPPCASFSTAGKRSKGWGEVKQYSDTKQRVDDLFFEYARLLKGLRPKVFVAENVSGLVKGVAKGYFKEIFRTLKDAGYNVKSSLLNAKWLGVPQSRERIIFVGVRADLGLEPAFPKPLPFSYSMREALEGLPDQSKQERQWLSETMASWWTFTPPGMSLDKGRRDGKSAAFTKTKMHPDRPSPTIMQKSNSGTLDLYMPDIPATPSIAELRRLSEFPDDFVLTGDFKQKWERIGRAVPPVMMYHIAQAIEREILCKIQKQ